MWEKWKQMNLFPLVGVCANKAKKPSVLTTTSNALENVWRYHFHRPRCPKAQLLHFHLKYDKFHKKYLELCCHLKIDKIFEAISCLHLHFKYSPIKVKCKRPSGMIGILLELLILLWITWHDWLMCANCGSWNDDICNCVATKLDWSSGPPL